MRDLESSYLTRAPGEESALEILQGHSITYRIAVGPHEGRKAFTLQTVPASERSTKPFLASHAGCPSSPKAGGALHLKDVLPGRHHARGLRAAGVASRTARWHRPDCCG